MRKPALLLLTIAACTSRPSAVPTAAIPVSQAVPPAISIIPLPQTVQLDGTLRFTLDSMTTVYADATADSSVTAVAAYVRAMLSPYVKTSLSKLAAGAVAPANSIRLVIDSSGRDPEGYEIVVSPNSAVITGNTSAGIFYGVQTLRQMLPVSVEHPAAVGRRLWLPVGRVQDAPTRTGNRTHASVRDPDGNTIELYSGR